MYGGSLPRAATQLLKDHAKSRSSSAPPARDRVFATGLAERGSARQDHVRVPRVGQQKSSGSARPPRAPPSKKPLSQILLDTGNYEREQEQPQQRGRESGEVQKRRLQNKNAFEFGSALPTTGITEAGAAALAAAEQRRRRVSFSPDCSSLPSTPEFSGLSAENDKLATDIIEGVRARQRELAGVDNSLAGYVHQAEGPAAAGSQGAGGRSGVRKEMVNASKRRLELKNAISRDMQDLEKLFELTQDQS